uniref:Protein kinase domain-containing protein n=1 Tax=Clastoptera arizonana TaxID=38151 RepID=A0A1B6CL83_9HEMI
MNREKNFDKLHEFNDSDHYESIVHDKDNIVMESSEDEDFIHRPVTPNYSNGSPLHLPETPIRDSCDSSRSRIFPKYFNSKRLDFHQADEPVSSTPVKGSPNNNLLPMSRKRSNSSQSKPAICYGGRRPKSPKTKFFEYVNPFSPDGLIAEAKRRSFLEASLSLRGNSDESTASLNTTGYEHIQRHRLFELNVARYSQEFIELCEIGRGHFGKVYKCLNRMNGCVYAIKKTIKRVIGTARESLVRNEIYALAVLEHPNLIRNYSSWVENGVVYIQNEYCNGGDLRNYTINHVFSENEVKNLLTQMVSAVGHIHSKGLAHMDIKPDNIFLHNSRLVEPFLTMSNNNTSTVTSNGEMDEDFFVFKLGDFGHAVPKNAPCAEDGDVRYLPMEMLCDKDRFLDRVDIFSLGLTIYEVMNRKDLPKNGDLWQSIRHEGPSSIPMFSDMLNNLIAQMVTFVPHERPTANEIFKTMYPNSKCSVYDDLCSLLYRVNEPMPLNSDVSCLEEEIADVSLEESTNIKSNNANDSGIIDSQAIAKIRSFTNVKVSDPDINIERPGPSIPNGSFFYIYSRDSDKDNIPGPSNEHNVGPEKFYQENGKVYGQFEGIYFALCHLSAYVSENGDMKLKQKEGYYIKDEGYVLLKENKAGFFEPVNENTAEECVTNVHVEQPSQNVLVINEDTKVIQKEEVIIFKEPTGVVLKHKKPIVVEENGHVLVQNTFSSCPQLDDIRPSQYDPDNE